MSSAVVDRDEQITKVEEAQLASRGPLTENKVKEIPMQSSSASALVSSRVISLCPQTLTVSQASVKPDELLSWHAVYRRPSAK